MNATNAGQLPNHPPHDFGGYWFHRSHKNSQEWHEHSHNAVQITLPLAGAPAGVLYRSELGKPRHHQIRAGQVCIFSSCQPHSLEQHESADLVLFYLEPYFIQQVMGDLIDLDKAEIIGQCAVHDPLIQNICKQFGGKNYRFAQMERLYQDALANLLAIHLVKTYSTQTFALPNLNEGLSSRQLKIILDYIHNHLEDEISLDDLARQLNLSRYYFSRLFKKSVGCSPYQYLIRQRVKLAQKLLICQDSSIADIACQCGFSNQSSMTKHFKQQTGVTPSHYRDRLSDYQPGVYFSGTSPGSTVHTGTH